LPLRQLLASRCRDEGQVFPDGLVDSAARAVAPDDPAVFAVLDDDLAAQNRLIPLSADEYHKLGQAFAAAPELRAHFDARDPALAEYMRDAMVAYASSRMA
jgi:hypothetical protein